jgi:flagellar motor switch protein FliN
MSQNLEQPASPKNPAESAPVRGKSAAETEKVKFNETSGQDLEPDELSPAAFQSLTDNGGKRAEATVEDLKLDVILDVPVTISMEIGRTRINIRNLLQLNQGSVVELDRLAGEPMDVLVNGTLIAHGEVVVVNDKFGIRLTDVISAAERVKKLK